MDSSTDAVKSIPIDRIFLDLQNPRHEPYKSEAEVIEYLCREEYVFELARDIAKIGLNPYENFALIPIDKKRGAGSVQSFTVAEGNRRLCAIKLLNDPDLAPAMLRKDFERLSESSVRVSEVRAVISDNKTPVDVWLDRIHGGVQGGIGRKPWSAEQKTRHIGDKKNVLAQAVLDYAEKHKLITAQDRAGKLTTAQRYLGNVLLREAIGIDSSNIEDLSRTRPEGDFDLLLRTFMDDLVRGDVHSRSSAADIVKYSRTLSATPGVSGQRTAPQSLVLKAGARKARKTPRRPQKPKHITYETEISQRLKAIPSYKLEKIYYSVCDIGLEDHTPLISVGLWAFFECLTAQCGRISGTAFPAFLSKNKLASLGFTNSENVKSMIQAISRISAYGNTTKHDDKSANFNGEQLANDMDTLRELICKLAEEAK